jgi:predicted AAA+ superfamily ATPase
MTGLSNANSKYIACIFKIYHLVAMSIINRQLTTAVCRQVEKYPILAGTGPRQSGKTTLLKQLFPEYRCVSLEPLIPLK